jgi:hypothetical protein
LNKIIPLQLNRQLSIYSIMKAFMNREMLITILEIFQKNTNFSPSHPF